MSHPWDHDIDIRPGSKVIFKRGDVEYTQTVESITYSTPPYVAARKLSRRERIMRWFTPKRWRKPLPQLSGGIPITTIKTTEPFWTVAVSSGIEKP